MLESIKPEYQEAIETFYGIPIVKCLPGPQQFIAKTFIISDNQNKHYFCKIVNNDLLRDGIIKTLPVVAEMQQKGIKNISAPISGNNGLHLVLDDTIIVLYDYIDATQGFDYNPFALGAYVAKIHNSTQKIVNRAPIETFEFPNEALFMERFKGILASNSFDPAIMQLKTLLQQHEVQNRRYILALAELGLRCKENPPPLVITHGDIATNILVKSPDDFYIIDWDEMRLSPAERDLWMLEQVAGYIDGYKSVRSDFTVNAYCRRFCILQYYFERMNLHFSDILNAELNEDFRIKRVQKLAQGNMAGWNLPKVAEVLK